MKSDDLIKFLHNHNIKFTLVIGITIIISWIIIAIFASFISPYDPNTLYLDNTFQYPNLNHIFGTDNYGRDIFSRVIHGSRIDLQMAIIGVVFPFIIGNFIGLLSGYFGGIIDSIIMRLLEITMSFPFFVLVIAIVSILGPGLKSFYIALALVGWVSYARLSRSQVLVVKNLDYILAAKTLGYGNMRIIFSHILPNSMTPSLVFSMTDAILVVLLGSALSYLGLGVQPPTAEWGVMIAEGQIFITSSWWMCLFPGLAIVLLALGFSLCADGLATMLNVKE
ncbi:MAG: ABC transporter permease [Fidelibacterota bacterium]|tara:strand:+ start:1636 stop:2475 length:840 start_codon:yes stop_codon:yes gene_type:complete